MKHIMYHYHSFIILTSFVLLTNDIAHCLFATKYWVVAEKINMVYNRNLDPNFEMKANLVVYS